MSVSKAQAKRIEESRKRVSKKKDEYLLKPIEPTRRQEVKYNRSLNEAIDQTKRSVMELYSSLNSPSDIDDELDSLFSNMTWWDDLNTNMGSQIDEMNSTHEEAFYNTITTGVGVNVAGFVSEQGLGDLLNAIVDDNINKVTDLKAGTQKRVADLIMNAITGQEDKSKTLEQQIRESFDVSKNQAKFIARDQTQRNVNTLNRFRQEKAGIEKYKWVTSKDKRVREDHAQMQGLEVDWATGIIQRTVLSIKRGLAGKNVKKVANGHVGQDYNCRCTAVPILEI